MTIQVTGSGLLSLVKDFGSDCSKSRLVAAAGYIRPDGKLAWTAFYEALLAAKGVIPAPVSRDEDDDYEGLTEDQKGLYDEIHDRIGEKWDHDDIMGMMEKVQDLGIETSAQFADALSFVADDPWHWQRDFIEDWMSNFSNEVPDFLVINYEATWNSTFQYDYDEIEHDGCVYVFNRNF